MADRDPAEQQLDTVRTDGQSLRKRPEKGNPGLEDSIEKSLDNQSSVKPDDYPEKAARPRDGKP